MIDENKVKQICEEIRPHYPHASLEELIDIAKKAVEEAEIKYKDLPEPKTLDLLTYTSYCIKQKIHIDGSWRLKEIELDKQNEGYQKAIKRNLKAIGEYMQTIEMEEDDPSIVSLPERKVPTIGELWKNFDDLVLFKTEEQILSDFKPIFSALEPKYINFIKSRNEMASAKGFKSQIDWILQGDRTLEKDYQYFVDNKEKIVEYCQKQLPHIKLPDWFYSQFNSQETHSFLSFLPNFPQLNFPDEIFDIVSKEFPILDKFRSKIDIDLVNGGANTRYLKHIDSFWIGIYQHNHYRRQAVTLIHELGHVTSMLQNFTKGDDTLMQGVDVWEYEAYSHEYALLKKLFPQIYQAAMADVLTNLVDVLFLIEAYKNPDQDLTRLYAKTFNYCFPDAKQKQNYTYLIRYNTVFRTFRSLPHSIAQVRVLGESLNE